MNLKEFFAEHKKAALAFSGGTDSAYLLYAAGYYGADVAAYYVQSQFQPAFEMEDAKRLAGLLGKELNILQADVLTCAKVAENPANRCYYCKQLIFGLITEAAFRDGYNIVMDGTNASDDAADRPGMAALKEMKVLSPLRMCDLTKTQIRNLSRDAGLFTWDKPAYACLATRISAGIAITQEQLLKTEAAENMLFRLGFKDFRVRMNADGSARVQVTKKEMPKAERMWMEISRLLLQWYPDAVLDPEGRG